jgi:biopolymer transport protein TolR
MKQLPPRPLAPGEKPRRRHLAAKRHDKGGVRAEINVTPLVDVVLVLLIIFMVITPMIARGVAVELPITAHHDKKADDNKDLIVSVTAAGEIYVGADKVPLERLTAAVQDERRRTPDKGVFFKADQRARYGDARKAMEAVHRAGVEDVQLGTDEKKEGGK